MKTQQEALEKLELPTDLSKSGAVSLRLSFTRAEAAKSLGISTESLDRLVKRGLIKPSRALRKPIFPVTELQRFLHETQTL